MTLKALGKDVAIYGAGEFVFKFIAFAVFPVYAHVLEVADFGRWALIAATTLLLGYLANLGINQAVQRFYFDDGADRADGPRIVSAGLVQLLASSVLLVGVALAAAAVLAERLERSFGVENGLLAIALVAIVPDQLLQFCSDVLRLHFTPLRFLLLSFVKSIGGTALSLYFLLVLHAGLRGLFAGLLIGSLAALPLGLWLIRRDLVWHLDRRVAGALFAFGFPLTFASIAQWIYTSLDRWMLAEMTSAQEVGLYSVAARFSTVLTFVVAAFAQAWIPFAIRMSRDDPDHCGFFARVLTLWFFLLTIAALGISLYSSNVLRLLTPPVYWAGAHCLPLLVAGHALFGTSLVAGLGVTLSNRTMLSTIATWLAGAVNVVLNVLLIPIGGARGTAAATFIALAVLSGFLLCCSQRLKPIPLQPVPLLYCCALLLGTVALSFGGLGDTGAAAAALKGGILLLAIAGGLAIGIVDRSTMWMLKPRGTPS